jgi:peptide/nickel transport system substrate-binding protein
MIELAVAFKESAAPAGIRINVQRHPSDGFWDVVWMEETFTIDRWYGRNPDQALSLEYCVTCAWNAPHYYNQALDDLVVKARGQKLEDQKKTYEEIQRILIDDVPQIVVAFQPWLYGVRSNLRGADPHPLGWGIFQDAWLDD